MIGSVATVSDRRWDVFISYGHVDGEWVRVLASNLHREAFDVFLDIWEVVGGDRVTGRLEEGIRGSRSGILVCSPEALGRPWVIEEYEALLRQAVDDPARRLIPVLLADAELPPFLGNRAWVDFRGAKSGLLYDRALSELVEALRGRPGSRRPDRTSARELPGLVGDTVRPAGAMALSLRLSRDVVTLVGGGDEVSQRPRGLQRATRDAVIDLARHRSRSDPDASVAYRGRAGLTMDAALADVGRRLSADFLGGAVGQALAMRVAAAERLGERAELGLEVHAELCDLPWEALVLPGLDGVVGDLGGTPLVLHHNLAVFRAVSGLGPTPAYKIRGPLRILVAIGSPESQDSAGELLNYEAELTRIVRAVEDARRGGSAYVRVLHRGTLAELRRALAEDLEGFHVLHLSCHAGPGELILEDDDGNEDRVSAERLVAEGVPAGTDLPLVVLAGCATGLRGRTGQDPDGALVSFAEALARRGVPQVLAMQAPVSDRYATELAGELYGWLASARDTDTLVALAEARRSCERRRQSLPATSPRRGAPEWATPALLVRGPRLPLYNRDETFGAVHAAIQPVLAEGVVVRGVGEFVGRRREEREGRRALASSKAGLVIYGIGGVGKSTLAAELVRSAGREIVVASKAGPLGVDTLLDEVGLRLGQAARASATDDSLLRAAQDLRRSEVEWGKRWQLLTAILTTVPLLVLLDNFEDNLTFDDGAWTVRDLEVGDLLARWARHPGRSRLLITSRYPFALTDDAHRRMATTHLGPLSPAETTKLIWQLPGLDALDVDERDRAYRDVGGHPRTLEYLDALLRGGEARFEDVAERMERQLTKRGIADPQAWLRSPGRGVDASLAEAVTLAVDDVVLGELLDQLSQTPLARELVVGASAYRHPVDETALAWQIATEIEPAADPDRETRMQRVGAAYQAAVASGDGQPSPESLGLSGAELTQYQADVAAQLRPPLQVPAETPAAMAAAASAGLLSPVTRADQPQLWFVHRWTARAIAVLQPASTRASHTKAARHWQWRVDRVPQSTEQDIEQLIEARFHHHAAGNTDAAVSLTGPIVHSLETWGHYGRAAELCRQTLGWVDDSSSEAGNMHGEIAWLAFLRGDLALAEHAYKRAIGILEESGDQLAAAANYANLATLGKDRGDYAAAETAYLRAIDIQKPAGDHHNVAANYNNLGILAQLRGDYDAADARYRESLEIQERLGDQSGMASTYGNLGILAQLRGDYDAADARYRESLEIQERLGDQSGMASTYNNLGILARLRGDYDAADARYRESLEIQERLGDQSGMASTYNNLGILARLRGDYDAADARYRESLEIQERLGDQSGMASTYGNLGILAQLRGDYDAADARYRESLEIQERLGDQSGMASTYRNLGILARLRGDYDAADARYRESLEIRERLGDQSGMATSYSNLADLHIAKDELEPAVGLNISALAIRARVGTPDATHNMARLSDLRTAMGADTFMATVAQALNAESQANLVAGLDDFAARKGDAERPQ